MLLRRRHDALVLSTVLAPGLADPRDWPFLQREWESVLRPPTAGVIGAVMILQAQAIGTDPNALDPGVLDPS